jgi:putative lipoprotein
VTRALARATAALAILAVAPAARADDWWARDKALHFGASATLAVGGYGAAALFTCSRPARLLAGGGLALAAGTAKEVADRYTGGDPSMKDFTWDVIGTATGLMVALLIERLVRSDRAQLGQDTLPVGCAVPRDRDVHGVADGGQQPVVLVAGALDRAAGLEEAAGAADEQERDGADLVAATVLLTVAHDHHHVVQHRAAALRRVFQLLHEAGDHGVQPGVDLDLVRAAAVGDRVVVAVDAQVPE